MDTKEMIKWSLKHWWWFVISVGVWLVIGGLYYFTTTPKYAVKSTIMLRHANENTGSDELMQAMGISGTKVTGDEIQVLSSRDLMGRVVDSLHLTTSYSFVNHGRKIELFPSEIVAVFPDTTRSTVTVDVCVKQDGYRIKVKPYQKKTERFTVKSLAAPLHTNVGNIHITMPKDMEEGHYRIVFLPRKAVADRLVSNIQFKMTRESSVINISTATTTPRRMVATINTLIDLYNQESTEDKNLLAIQTEQFLATRISVVEQELNHIEASIEAYKRAQQISDLSRTANAYQEMGDDYEQQVADLDDQIRLMQYYLDKLSEPNKSFAIIPGDFSGSLGVMINEYNTLVTHREMLLRSATEKNPLVESETGLLIRNREYVKEGLQHDIKTLSMKRDFVLSQQKQYASRLASLPETERRYLEICREKETKEKQYIFLIEKREENSMLLSAETLPARIIERAQQDTSPVSPQLKIVFLVVFFLGCMMPLLVYFFEVFRKEYL